MCSNLPQLRETDGEHLTTFGSVFFTVSEISLRITLMELCFSFFSCNILTQMFAVKCNYGHLFPSEAISRCRLILTDCFTTTL